MRAKSTNTYFKSLVPLLHNDFQGKCALLVLFSIQLSDSGTTAVVKNKPTVVK